MTNNNTFSNTSDGAVNSTVDNTVNVATNAAADTVAADVVVSDTSNVNEAAVQMTPPAQEAAQFPSFTQQSSVQGSAAPMPPVSPMPQSNLYQAAPVNPAIPTVSGGNAARMQRMNSKLIALVVGVSLACGVVGGLGGGLTYGAIAGGGSSNSQQMQVPDGMPGGSGGSQGGMGGGSGQGGNNSQNGQPGEPPSGSGQSGSGSSGSSSNSSGQSGSGFGQSESGSNSSSDQESESELSGSDGSAAAV